MDISKYSSEVTYGEWEKLLNELGCQVPVKYDDEEWFLRLECNGSSSARTQLVMSKANENDAVKIRLAGYKQDTLLKITIDSRFISVCNKLKEGSLVEHCIQLAMKNNGLDYDTLLDEWADKLYAKMDKVQNKTTEETNLYNAKNSGYIDGLAMAIAVLTTMEKVRGSKRIIVDATNDKYE